MDILPHLLLAGLGERSEGGKTGKKRRRNKVYPGVGALGGEPHGEEQLIVLFIVQRAESGRVQALQLGNDGVHFSGRFQIASPLAAIIIDAKENCNSHKTVIQY